MRAQSFGRCYLFLNPVNWRLGRESSAEVFDAESVHNPRELEVWQMAPQE
jgi:hypothetical protein